MIDPFEQHCWLDVMPPEDLETYAKYIRPRTLTPRAALLLIDVYNGAYGDRPEPRSESMKRFPMSCGQAAWDALEPTKDVLATAREAGIPIFFTTQEPRPEAHVSGFTATRRLGGREGVDRTWAFTIVEPLTPIPGETMVYKQRASGFFGTPLEAHLRLLGIDTVLILGESTSGCVRSSVLDAYSQGFQVAVIEECTFDRSDLVHKVNLFDMHHKYAEVVHADDSKDFIRSIARVPAGAIA